MKTLTLLFPLSLLAVLAVGGCKPKTAPTTAPATAVNNGNGSETTQAKPAEKPPESLLPQTLKVRFQGRNAEQWAQGLMDLDEVRCNHASIALEKIGEESLRFIYDALKTGNEQTKFYSLYYALDPRLAIKYGDVFKPLLINLLKDNSERVRKNANSHLERIK